METRTLTISETDYSSVLETYGLTYQLIEHYWQVGEIKGTQGWILHLSGVESTLPALFSVVIPVLIQEGAAFKIVRDRQMAGLFLEGSVGYANLGKMISIYPESDEQAVEWAKKFITLTQSFRGPAIPTDRQLGGIVYTRYGSFSPVIKTNTKGETEKYIYNAHGALVPDQYVIPFMLPPGITWPFSEITTAMPPKTPKLLNQRYYPLTVMKPDVKGVVMQGLYFKSIIRIRQCLLKQGKKNMFLDDAGRDIQDRLQWQYNLYQALHEDIPMPEIFDYFQDEAGDKWLAMEFIKGDSLKTWIDRVNANRCWRQLSASTRLRLLDKLLELLAIIQRLHEKGYVHRDIMPDNFMIDKKGAIYLIDMELAWHTATETPDPPYRLGTPGHMSPEQRAISRPTFREDVYGLGGIMMLLFTNLYPTKFLPSNQGGLRETMYFFTNDHQIADIVSVCQHDDPDRRPTVPEIIHVVKEVRDRITPLSGKFIHDEKKVTVTPATGVLSKILHAGLQGLCMPPMINSGSCWLSLAIAKEERIGNDQRGMALYGGWYTGMAGPGWIMSQARKAGILPSHFYNAYSNSWNFIQQCVEHDFSVSSSGLYAGTAGIAVSLADGVDSGLMEHDPAVLSFLQSLFSHSAASLNMTEGLAGQGIGLLKVRHLLPSSFCDKMLDELKGRILQAQQMDGSWKLNNQAGRPNDILFGIDHGIAGVLWFLLHYLQAYPSDEIRSAVERGLRWLLQKRKKKDNTRYWTAGMKNEAVLPWSTGQGIPGMALLFLKAYEILEHTEYGETAADTLAQLPEQPVTMNFTLGDGLAGLGHVYLEAFRILEDSRWNVRAEWIQQVFVNSFMEEEKGSGHWLSNAGTIFTPDLFTGNSGILHFLLRCAYPEKIQHPLSAIK